MEPVQEKRRNGRIAALVMAGILPLMLLVLGVLMLMGDSVITGSFVITFMVLPVIAYTGCYFVIRARWHPAVRGIGCIAILVAMVFLFIFMMGSGHFSIFYSEAGEEAIAQYEKDTRDISRMPDIAALGETEEIRYHYFFDQWGVFFDSNCYMLFCRYTEEEYARQTDRIGAEYVFQTEPLTAHGYAVDPTVTMDGYEFRFLSFNDYKLVYPKYMMLIATNEENHEVVYLWYEDDDLDYIESIEEHFLESFGWKYIE